jgi:gluconolactonase
MSGLEGGDIRRGEPVTLDVTIHDARMRDLVLPIAPLERISTGHLWAEGPVWHPAGQFLLWSDIPRNRTYQWVPELGVRVFSHDSNYTNGQTMDPEGRRIVCEHLSRSVVRYSHSGAREVLADSHQGRRLNSPNDVVVAGDGAVWFTDPTYGILSDYEGRRADPEQPGCYVYRIDPVTAAVEARITSMIKPNGLAFSPACDRLYVADSSASHDDRGHRHVMGFAIGPGGSVGPGAIVAEVSQGVPDGLRVDEFGHLWVSSSRGVEVFAPDGTPLGVLNLPETAANLCFGGPKGNRLFITASSSVYAVYTAVCGAGRIRRT